MLTRDQFVQGKSLPVDGFGDKDGELGDAAAGSDRYDALRYDLDLKIDPGERAISGTVGMTLAAVLGDLAVLQVGSNLVYTIEVTNAGAVAAAAGVLVGTLVTNRLQASLVAVAAWFLLAIGLDLVVIGLGVFLSLGEPAILTAVLANPIESARVADGSTPAVARARDGGFEETERIREALLVDADDSGIASPGDTLRYTITIEHTGQTTAVRTVLNDSPDPNTVLLTESLATSTGTIVTGDQPGDNTIDLRATPYLLVTVDSVARNPNITYPTGD